MGIYVVRGFCGLCDIFRLECCICVFIVMLKERFWSCIVLNRANLFLGSPSLSSGVAFSRLFFSGIVLGIQMVVWIGD